MKRPGFLTWLLGSRFTAPLIILGMAWYIFQWWQAGGAGGTGLAAIALLLLSAKSAYEVGSYRRWRADWRAMTPGGQSRRWRPSAQAIFSIAGGLTVVAAILYGSGPYASPEFKQAMAPIASGSAALGVAIMLGRWVWRMATRRRAARVPPVAIAIRRPVVTIRSLDACYLRLPPYAQKLLKGRTQ